MAITYRTETKSTTSLDADVVRAIFRRLGGKGIERTCGWTPAVIAILRENRT